MDTLLAQIPTSSEVGRAALYDQVDAQAWTDAVDLPLVAVPVIVATNRQLLNVEPGPYYGNIVWNEQDWGYQA
jgi:ABC-type transport system substrate-binding protein